MKLLITGGCGFIGSNFIRYWDSKYPDDQIVNVDALTYAARPSYLDFMKSRRDYCFERADITHRIALQRIFQKHDPDVVVHFAAESHVCRSIEGPDAFIHSNIVGTFNLLEEARACWSKPGDHKEHYFLHVSTDEVFGELPIDRPDLRFDEFNALRPTSPYSASKASSDMLVQCYHDTYGMKTFITNCSNNFGPNQHSEKLIPRTIQRLLDGEPMTVYGKGNQVRDWLWVFDHCSAIETILQNGTPGERYCIGGECELPNLSVMRSVHKALSEFLPVKLDLQHTDNRPSDDLRYAIDCSKLKSLGWRPSNKFEENLEATIRWYMRNEEWGKRWMNRSADSGSETRSKSSSADTPVGRGK
jgi:dTDP-glucose 4,6-dehydratase